MHGLVGPRAVLQANSVEWWTPSIYIETARKVMGGIDLDPASIAEANLTVKAKRFFDRAVNGLTKEWSGRIWLNPPYGREVQPFIEKLLDEWRSGHVSQAVVLLNSNSIESMWFVPLRQFPLCIPRGRIHFISPDIEPRSATHGSVFVYCGNRHLAFARHFCKIGDIFKIHAKAEH